jgi:methionyl-tRNA formyltransferase
MRIIFFGTPRFAEIILEKIIADKGYEILAVVTTPDEPVGRKQILTAPPVKVLAEKYNLKVLQPEKLDEGFYQELYSVCHSGLPPDSLRDSKRAGDPESRKNNGVDSRFRGNDTKEPRHDTTNGADLFVVAAYGKIIPKNILDLPKFGCLNVHPSLLPKYRGASPIQSALLNGDKETGVTIMLMDEKMDNGPKISEIRYQISETDTTEILMGKLAETGADLLLETTPDYLSGKIKPVEQDHAAATFCKIIKKSDGEIDWHKPAEQIYNQWQAFWPWPGVFADIKIQEYKNIKIKFVELSLVDKKDEKHKAGEIFTENDKLFVAGGNHKLLEIKKLQPEGKKIMEAKEFINGYLTRK